MYCAGMVGECTGESVVAECKEVGGELEGLDEHSDREIELAGEAGSDVGSQ